MSMNKQSVSELLDMRIEAELDQQFDEEKHDAREFIREFAKRARNAEHAFAISFRQGTQFMDERNDCLALLACITSWIDMIDDKTSLNDWRSIGCVEELTALCDCANSARERIEKYSVSEDTRG